MIYPKGIKRDKKYDAAFIFECVDIWYKLSCNHYQKHQVDTDTYVDL